MDNTEGRKYTAREAATHLSLIADHLKDYSQGGSTVGFCLECLGKHFSSLRGLAAEGQDFFSEDREFWLKLRYWVDEMMDKMEAGEAAEALIAELTSDSRVWRKTIQSKYFGKLGTCGASGKKACTFVVGSSSGKDCKCLTGFEPCCRE